MIDLERAYPPAVPPAGLALWLPFVGGELLTRLDAGLPLFLVGETDTPPVSIVGTPLFLGTRAGLPVFAADAEGGDIPGGLHAHGLRTLLGLLPDSDAALAGYASQLLYWRRTSGFCPVCGTRTDWKGGDWGRVCPTCGHVAYPHISPAVLVLIHDSSRILLVHKPEWKTMHSIVAGFVEPGETLEECVRREVKEEVGANLGEIMYAGSQAWPFPHQLMVGFVAQYAGGEISLDTDELDSAAWYEADALPDLPLPISLSRVLIDTWWESILSE